MRANARELNLGLTDNSSCGDGQLAVRTATEVSVISRFDLQCEY